ncbi:DUF4091 domain-containing protein [Cohnella soli]|uniref:DUF4091 domain-containing protein n=1 Tax=Cohnella soli TaxID=425005 RepID=A0ABW0HZ81_9BACL
MLTVGNDSLFWKGGPLTIARIGVEMEGAIDVEVKIVGLVDDNNRTMKADTLLDQSHIFVKKRTVQPIWVECHASPDTPPGRYEGTVKMFARMLFEDEREVAKCSFSLVVKPYTLPEPKDYKFYLDLWQHHCNIARKYNMPLWSDGHFTVLNEYFQSMGQLGQKAVSCVVSDIPWIGQSSFMDPEPSDLFEYSIIGVERDIDGAFHYDYSSLDRLIELAESQGIDQEIEVFGLLNVWQDPAAGYGGVVEDYPDGMRVRYFDKRSQRYCFIRHFDHISHYVKSLEAHFIDKGWIDKVRVLADEPADMTEFLNRLNTLRSIAPSFKYKIAVNHAEFIRAGIEGICDFVPIIVCAANEYEKMQELRDRISGRLLYYVCCGPQRPNTFVSSPPLESRLIAWLTEKLQYDGFLRWSYTAWPDDPLRQISYRASLPTGDMHFVYPGASGKPMLSLRYKWLQRGIRDFEFMQLLKAEGRAEAVTQALNDVIRFTHPSELYAPGKEIGDLYSLNESDYDRLLHLS